MRSKPMAVSLGLAALALLSALVFVTVSTVLAQEEAPAFEWIRQFGTATDDFGSDVALGQQGKIHTVGWTLFGGSFIKTFDSAGNQTGNFQFGGGLTRTNQIEVGPNGEIVVGGTDFPIPQAPPPRTPLVFVTKFNPDFTVSWTNQIDSLEFDAGGGVSIGPQGEVVVSGFTVGALEGPTSAGGFDAFVRKYGSNGNVLWTRQFGTDGDDFGTAAVGPNGEVYFGGRAGGTLPDQTSTGSSDAFVRKYDSNGNEIWTRQFGTPVAEGEATVAVGLGGGVYVAGVTRGELVPGVNPRGGLQVYVRKYDSNGNVVWTSQFGSCDLMQLFGPGHRLTVGPEGEAYVTGFIQGSCLGISDAFVTKFDPDGNLVWTQRFGSTPEIVDRAAAVALGPRSELFIAGHTPGALPGQTFAGGNFDAFILKLEAQALTPEEAIAAVATDIQAIIDAGGIPPETQADLEDAVQFLLGNATGNANNGALDKLASGDLGAALNKTRQAIANLQAAQAAGGPDTTGLQQTLAQAAADVTQTTIEIAAATVGADQALIDQAQALFNEGVALISATPPDFVGAVSKFIQAVGLAAAALP